MKEEVKIVKKICLLFIVLSMFIILISGCGRMCPSTCDDYNDCTTDFCSKETKYECKHTPIVGCYIGNGVCEPELGETRCNAPKDCGPCDSSALNVTSDYLEAACDEANKCGLHMKEGVTPQPFSKILNLGGFKVSFKAIFEQPFNVDEAVINLEVELTDVSQDTIEPKISKLQLTSTIDRKEMILGETEVDKVLFEIGDKIYDELIFSYQFNEQELELTILRIKIFYEYKMKRIGREDEIRRGSIDYTISSPLIFVNPTKVVECELSDCDDNNPATFDVCIEGTAFCKHERIPNRCRNFWCEAEAGENRCTCPQDCGKCERNYGDFLEFKCSGANRCISQIRTEILTKTFANEKTTRFFTFNVESSMNQPFKVDSTTTAKSDKIKFTIKLIDKNEDLVSPPEFTMVEVFGYSQELLGKMDIKSNNKLEEVGSYVTFEVPLSFIMDYLEEERTLSPKLYYEYTYRQKYWEGSVEMFKNVLERESYPYNIAIIDFVNPDQ